MSSSIQDKDEESSQETREKKQENTRVRPENQPIQIGVEAWEIQVIISFNNNNNKNGSIHGELKAFKLMTKI